MPVQWCCFDECTFSWCCFGLYFFAWACICTLYYVWSLCVSGEWLNAFMLFFMQTVRTFLLNFHLYGRQFVHRIQCFTCHAANTHSLIHMNVWSTTTTAAKKNQKRIFSPNINRPVNQPASQFNVIEYSEILYDNNWTQLQIGAHFIKVREKKAVHSMHVASARHHFDNLCISCLHLSVPKCNRFVLVKQLWTIFQVQW